MSAGKRSWSGFRGRWRRIFDGRAVQCLDARGVCPRSSRFSGGEGNLSASAHYRSRSPRAPSGRSTPKVWPPAAVGLGRSKATGSPAVTWSARSTGVGSLAVRSSAPSTARESPAVMWSARSTAMSSLAVRSSARSTAAGSLAARSSAPSTVKAAFASVASEPA